jgi:ParB-like chromosome segregation protein Spo0J
MKLQVEYVPISKIKPYKRNAKLHPQEQIEQIKNSMQEFGNIDPIGVWHDEIVEGHGRYEALRQMGVKEVPVIRLDDLTDEQRRAYSLAHNKLTMNSDFDVALLDTELAEIETIDMTLLGFDENVGAEPPQNLDDDTEKESIVITLNIKSQVDYEMIKQKVTEIIDGLDVSMAVKMA